MNLDGLYVLMFVIMVYPAIVLTAWAVTRGARRWRECGVGSQCVCWNRLRRWVRS